MLSSVDNTVGQRDNNEHWSVIEVKVSTNFILLCGASSEEIAIDFQWLRDHCRCTLCFDSFTYQRKSTVLDFLADVKPQSYELSMGTLFITWNNGHESKYEINWLKENAMFEGDKEVDATIPWFTSPKVAKVNYDSYMNTSEGLIKIVHSLLQYGVALVNDAKPTLETTEQIAIRLAPVQKTFFGDIWELNHDLKAVLHKDTAYTHDALGPHNDNTYWSDAAGLQLFHCFKPASSGGQTILVDGLQAVQDLKSRYPACYERLLQTPVAACYIEDGQRHSYVSPIIKLHPVTKTFLQIRFNLYDRSVVHSVRQSEVGLHYNDLRVLASLINEPNRKWMLPLEIGDVLFIDNWRILHGRNSYVGTRHLSGCYISRTDWHSKAAVLGLSI